MSEKVRTLSSKHLARAFYNDRWFVGVRDFDHTEEPKWMSSS
jgi:hypothetical protein